MADAAARQLQYEYKAVSIKNNSKKVAATCGKRLPKNDS